MSLLVLGILVGVALLPSTICGVVAAYRGAGASAGTITAGLFVLHTAVFVFVGGLWRVFQKAGLPGWQCLVPVANISGLLRVAGLPRCWIAVYLIPLFAPLALVPIWMAAQLDVMMYSVIQNHSMLGIVLGIVGLVLLVNAVAMLLVQIMVCYGVARNFGQGLLVAVGLWFLPFIVYPLLGFGPVRYVYADDP